VDSSAPRQDRIRSFLSQFTPKSVLAFRSYKLSDFPRDLLAGVTVGLVAVPLAIAFAIASGVPPQAGLVTAIIAGFLVSALGGSKMQIAGPTGAFVVVVSGIIAKHGLEGLFTCTLLSGIFLILLGLTGLGSAVRYIPRPVVIGFTNGIAVLIASTQLRDFFGLEIAKVPSEFWDRMAALAGHASTINPLNTGVAAGSLLVLIAVRKWLPKIPGAILVMIGVTALVAGLRLPLETVVSRYGPVPSSLPPLHVPALRFDLMLPLMSAALTVTMLGAIESLLSAVVADRMSGDKHNPGVELVAQGVANVVSPLWGGLPATGAIARTATNIRSGAVSPLSGMIHAIVVLLVVLFAAPLAGQIPLAALAAILIMVSYNMGEWAEIPTILKLGKADIAVWLITFFLTVFADLTVAVQAGMILAALLFIRRVATTTTVSRVTPEYVESSRKHSLQLHEIPDQVAVYRVSGPLLFGSTEKIEAIREDLASLPPVVVLRLRNMTALDGTGLHSIEELAEALHASGRTLILCGMRSQPRALMDKAGITARLGPENVCADVSHAMDRAREILAQ